MFLLLFTSEILPLLLTFLQLILQNCKLKNGKNVLMERKLYCSLTPTKLFL